MDYQEEIIMRDASVISDRQFHDIQPSQFDLAGCWSQTVYKMSLFCCGEMCQVSRVSFVAKMLYCLY